MVADLNGGRSQWWQISMVADLNGGRSQWWQISMVADLNGGRSIDASSDDDGLDSKSSVSNTKACEAFDTASK